MRTLLQEKNESLNDRSKARGARIKGTDDVHVGTVSKAACHGWALTNEEGAKAYKGSADGKREQAGSQSLGPWPAGVIADLCDG